MNKLALKTSKKKVAEQMLEDIDDLEHNTMK
jgi:hypothetical protein